MTGVEQAANHWQSQNRLCSLSEAKLAHSLIPIFDYRGNIPVSEEIYGNLEGNLFVRGYYYLVQDSCRSPDCDELRI